MKHHEKEQKAPGSTAARVLKILLGIPAGIIALALVGLLILTAMEYRPEAVEEAEEWDSSETAGTLSPGESFTIASWNIGYGALGDNADFFMDGGKMVNTADRARVLKNLTGIRDELASVDPDVVFLQETDRNSTRSHGVDEMRFLMGDRSDPTFATGMSYAFACNFRAPFVPYPIPPIGRVDSGIVTLTAFPVREATRIQLFCPFSWPVRIANLKRCLLVTRIPVEGSDRELVLVNLHLEAYDSGEGKKQQTKQLVSLLEREMSAGNYVIAGGDFNQKFSSVDASAFPSLSDMWVCGSIDEASFPKGFRFYMDDRVPSCRSLDRPLAGAPDTDPAAFQYYLIDGYIVSDNLDVERFEVRDLGFVCADHNPTVMTVRLKADGD